MTINLIVEDGTGISNANTYITVSEARQYANDRGIDLGSDDNAIAANLVLASDYMELTSPYKGYMFSDLQGLEFPRKDQKDSVVSNGIPQKVKKAQAQLLLDIKESGALLTTSRQFALKRRKIEGLEQEFAVGAYATYKPNAVHAVYNHLMSAFLVFQSGQLIR